MSLWSDFLPDHFLSLIPYRRILNYRVREMCTHMLTAFIMMYVSSGLCSLYMVKLSKMTKPEWTSQPVGSGLVDFNEPLAPVFQSKFTVLPVNSNSIIVEGNLLLWDMLTITKHEFGLVCDSKSI